MRMRRRRAERCVLRAEIALEAGFEDDAREALEEAHRLDPNTPDFDTVLATVVPRMRETVAADPVQKPHRTRRSLAVAAIVLASLAGTAALVNDWSTPEAAPASQLAVVDPGSVGSSSSAGPRSDSRSERALATVAAGSLGREVGNATPIPVETTAPGPVSAEPKDIESRNVEPKNPEPTTPELKNVELPVREMGIENRVVTAKPVATPLPLIELPAAPAPTVPAAPAPEPIVDDSVRVRAVLSQYEAAYSGLNVAAARAIWPSVDARLLRRAFDGLASQRVSLGQCSVSIDGRVARADCQGHASYTPKVGGGARSETRRWRFELRNAEGTWQIVHADAR